MFIRFFENTFDDLEKTYQQRNLKKKEQESHQSSFCYHVVCFASVKFFFKQKPKIFIFLFLEKEGEKIIEKVDDFIFKFKIERRIFVFSFFKKGCCFFYRKEVTLDSRKRNFPRKKITHTQNKKRKKKREK